MIVPIKNFCRGLSREITNFANLIARNIALGQQLIVLSRNHKRPLLTPEIEGDVLKMAEANPPWGTPAIHDGIRCECTNQ